MLQIITSQADVRILTVEEAARRLKVAPATLYRHLPGGRSAVVQEEP